MSLRRFSTLREFLGVELIFDTEDVGIPGFCQTQQNFTNNIVFKFCVILHLINILSRLDLFGQKRLILHGCHLHSWADVESSKDIQERGLSVCSDCWHLSIPDGLHFFNWLFCWFLCLFFAIPWLFLVWCICSIVFNFKSNLKYASPLFLWKNVKGRNCSARFIHLGLARNISGS